MSRTLRHLPAATLVIAILAGCAYLALLIANFAYLIDAQYWDFDATSSLLLADRMMQPGPSGTVFVGQPGNLTVFRATGWLPAHHAIWMAIPVLFAIATVLISAWVVARLRSKRAAILTAVLLVAVSPLTLRTYLSPQWHGATWPQIALEAAVLIWFFLGLGPRRTLIRVVIAAGLALWLGFWTASDPLLGVAASAPLGLVALWLIFRTRRGAEHTAGWWLWGIVGGSVAVALITDLIWERFGWLAAPISPGPVRVGTLSEIARSTGYFLPSLWSAYPASDDGLVQIWEWPVAILAVIFIAAPPLLIMRRRNLAAGDEHPPAVFRVIGIFWLLSNAFMVFGFLLSNIPTDWSSGRYLFSIVMAAAFVLPVWAAKPRQQAAVAILFAIIAITATVQLDRAVASDYYRRDQVPVQGLAVFLHSHGLTRGYAPGKDANPMSWVSGQKMYVSGVMQICAPGYTHAICRYYEQNRASDYYPQPGPSFFVFDPNQAQWDPKPPAPELFGDPAEVLTYDRFTIYVYNYDIAAHFAPI